MKTFYVSLVTFFSLLSLIGWNTAFIRCTVQDLETELNTLPACEQATAAVEALATHWQQKKPRVGLSVKRDVIREMDDRLAELQTAAAIGDAEGYAVATQRVRVLLTHIRDAERFSVDNLF